MKKNAFLLTVFLTLFCANLCAHNIPEVVAESGIPYLVSESTSGFYKITTYKQDVRNEDDMAYYQRVSDFIKKRNRRKHKWYGSINSTRYFDRGCFLTDLHKLDDVTDVYEQFTYRNKSLVIELIYDDGHLDYIEYRDDRTFTEREFQRLRGWFGSIFQLRFIPRNKTK